MATLCEIKVPTFTYTRDGATAKRVFWLQEYDELDDVLESYFGTTFAAGGQIVQGELLTFPGKPWLILDTIDIRTHDEDDITGTDSNGVAYSNGGWILDLSYTTPEFDQDELNNDNQDLPETPNDTFLTVRTTLSGQIMTIPNEGLEWLTANDDSSTDVGSNTNAGIVVPMIAYQLTWHFVVNPNWSAIRAGIGTVNSTTFLGHPAESVLFEGLESSRQYQVDGTRKWEITFRFVAKDLKYTDPTTGTTSTAGWNHFYRSDPGAGDPNWQQIVVKSGLKDIYVSTDLNELFSTATQ